MHPKGQIQKAQDIGKPLMARDGRLGQLILYGQRRRIHSDGKILTAP